MKNHNVIQDSYHQKDLDTKSFGKMQLDPKNSPEPSLNNNIIDSPSETTKAETTGISVMFSSFYNKCSVCAKTNDFQNLKNFIAGGIAGGVSRTVVSPLERMKILFQVQGPKNSSYNGVLPTLRKIWIEEGVMGYMRGNGTNVVRIVPYSAVQFAAYEKYKKLFLDPSSNELSTKCRLIAGALAGITSVVFTYPLDIVRTRLSIQSAFKATNPHRKLPGIWGTMINVYKTERGIVGLYQGINPTILGVAPYVAFNFQVYEVLRKSFTKEGLDSPSGIDKLICGAISGSVAQTLTYPLDVLRRRMQVTGMKGVVDFEYKNTYEATKHIYKTEGIRGFYKGMLPNYLKVAPAIGVSFYVYELMKSLL